MNKKIVIGLMNLKGGSGKTTLATSLAVALHRQGKRVILVDTDPQGSLRDWRAASPEAADLPQVIALDRPNLLSAIAGLDADYVIVDTPATADAMSAAVIRYSDVALIVIRPSNLDLWASATTVALINQKINVGGNINAAFLVNSTNSSTALTKSVSTGEWNEYDIPQLKSSIGTRAAFATALSNGISVFDLADKKAQSEVNNLVEELKAAQWI